MGSYFLTCYKLIYDFMLWMPQADSNEKIELLIFWIRATFVDASGAMQEAGEGEYHVAEQNVWLANDRNFIYHVANGIGADTKPGRFGRSLHV